MSESVAVSMLSRTRAALSLADPFKDHLEIRIPEDGTVTLYDMNGRALMQKQLQAGTNIIPTGTLANGTYLLSYKGETLKVVRE